MQFNKRWTSIGILAAVIASAGCASAAGGGSTDPAAGAAGDGDFEAIYRARTDSLRMRFTEADVRFVTGMIAHHAQAIVMARLAPTNGAGPTVRTLAARIINAQNDEIALMQQWLRDRRQPVPEVHADPAHADHSMHMPGMLTPEQLQQLARAKGTEFDRLFLTFMIQHHRGAVTMVDELFKVGGAAQGEAVFKIANDVQVDQTTEINRMEQMLARMPRDLP
jgi:uncharacterized protein (DUF305 family)